MILLLMISAGLVVVLWKQYPALVRYLKIKSM